MFNQIRKRNRHNHVNPPLDETVRAKHVISLINKETLPKEPFSAKWFPASKDDPNFTSYFGQFQHMSQDKQYTDMCKIQRIAPQWMKTEFKGLFIQFLSSEPENSKENSDAIKINLLDAFFAGNTAEQEKDPIFINSIRATLEKLIATSKPKDNRQHDFDTFSGSYGKLFLILKNAILREKNCAINYRFIEALKKESSSPLSDLFEKAIVAGMSAPIECKPESNYARLRLKYWQEHEVKPSATPELECETLTYIEKQEATEESENKKRRRVDNNSSISSPFSFFSSDSSTSLSTSSSPIINQCLPIESDAMHNTSTNPTFPEELNLLVESANIQIYPELNNSEIITFYMPYISHEPTDQAEWEWRRTVNGYFSNSEVDTERSFPVTNYFFSTPEVNKSSSSTPNNPNEDTFYSCNYSKK